MSGIASLAEIRAIEAQGLPADLPASTYEMIRRGAAIDPSAPALSFFLRAEDHREAECWTYSELLRDITRAANMFLRLGVSKDSVVAYVLPNLPETHFVIWGGEAAGIVCAINPLLEGAAMADLLQAVGAEVLVTLGPFPGTDLWPKIHPVLERLPSLRHLVLVNLADRVPGPKGPDAKLMQRLETSILHGYAGLRGAVPAHIEVHDFGRAIARETGSKLNSGRHFSAQDFSSYFCTGGTTGLPKIAMRCHGSEVTNAWSAGQYLGEGIGPGKTMFCGLPLFHVNAVMATGLIPFSKGAHVILGTPQGYRGNDVIKRFWEIIEHHRVNFFSGVPTLYSTLLEVPIDGHDLGSLEYGLCGAAPMPIEVFNTFEECTGIKILEGYGLTEGACVSSINPPRGERRVGSIGLCIPWQAMKAIVLDDAGRYVRDCATDEIGVIAISGPNVFAGYSQAEQNKGLWLDLGDDKRWLNTGDLGRCDAEGYFWLTGRKKDLIIRGGHNIDPAAIEEPLHRHAAVQIAAAIGRPDAHAGELPVAYVQLKPGATASEQELMAFVGERISERAAMPKHIRIVEAMPLTGVGKIFKPELKRRETLDAIRAALTGAGIHDARVAIDARKPDLVVQIELPDPELEPKAKAVLGRFSHPFSITWHPLPSSAQG
ncbi:MAG TPA: acyl-CoA synthetase [Aliidongia sp.]|nr:acyl-CoA synthetase [Aliidongia sp.]